MDKRRLGSHGFYRIDDRLEFLVVDFDEAEACFCRRSAVRCHHRDFLAGEAYNARREQRQIEDSSAIASRWEVGRGQNGPNAG